MVMADRARAPMLAEDLLTLGLDVQAISRLPRCDHIFRPTDEASFMGALYVVEGSTLGGLHIARALSSLFGGSEGEGRRFFLGYGARHSVMWRGFLEQLDAFAGDEGNEAAAIEGAVKTFADFESWMGDWRRAAL
jgi:heme oxygenase